LAVKHIFEEGELNENSVVRKFRTTAADGKITKRHFTKKQIQALATVILLRLFVFRKIVVFL